jgi:hypothetical protein
MRKSPTGARALTIRGWRPHLLIVSQTGSRRATARLRPTSAFQTNQRIEDRCLEFLAQYNLGAVELVQFIFELIQHLAEFLPSNTLKLKIRFPALPQAEKGAGQVINPRTTSHSELDGPSTVPTLLEQAGLVSGCFGGHIRALTSQSNGYSLKHHARIEVKPSLGATARSPLPSQDDSTTPGDETTRFHSGGRLGGRARGGHVNAPAPQVYKFLYTGTGERSSEAYRVDGRQSRAGAVLLETCQTASWV